MPTTDLTIQDRRKLQKIVIKHSLKTNEVVFFDGKFILLSDWILSLAREVKMGIAINSYVFRKLGSTGYTGIFMVGRVMIASVAADIGLALKRNARVIVTPKLKADLSLLGLEGLEMMT